MDWTKELQKYLRINTAKPSPNYHGAIEYLIDLTQRISGNLKYRVLNSNYNNAPLLLVTKPGRRPKSILLNSRIDVLGVPNDMDWTYPPFEGHYDPDNDRLYGRGVQDMKSQSIQYMAALYNLRNTQLEYTVHVAFMPSHGISEFVKTSMFRALDVTFVLDESCASPFQHFLFFYTERTVWQFAVKIQAPAGHAALPTTDTCENKLRRLLVEIDKFRMRDAKTSGQKIGYMTTINMTRLESNNSPQALPSEMYAYFDMQIGVETSLNKIFDEIEQWTLAASPNNNDVTIEWIHRAPKSLDTNMNNEMCIKFLQFFLDNKIPYNVTVAPSATDARYLRNEGIPVIGFTPINMTPILMNNTDEYIYKKQFIQNIDLMTNLIKYLTH